MKKKILSVFLAVCMIFTLLPVSALADTTTSGKCGDNLTWTLKNGTLTISGTGAMYDWDSAPWSENSESITKVVIKDGVTSIGEDAFSHCRSLASVTIPNSVTSIGEYAFWVCSSLTSITIPDSVTSIGDHAFSACGSLASVTMGKGVTSIGEWAFDCCSSLTSVTIPDSVASIGDCAFYGCSSLTSVTMGKGVTSIGGGAFSSCNNIKKVYYTGNLSSWLGIDFGDWASNPSYSIPSSNPNYNKKTTLYINGKLLTDVVIPNGVTSIGNYAFFGCESMTSVTIPDSVTSIGVEAFYNCFSLKSVTIGNGVISIGGQAFKYCESLASVTMGKCVTSIDYQAFYDCNNIEKVYYTGNISSWLGIDFEGISSTPCRGNLYFNGKLVTDVVIPNGIKSIGNYAFKDCSSLTSVTIPNSVTSIGNYAFRGCSNLTSVTIPNSVTSVGDHAFSACSSLTSVTIGNSVTSIGNYAFDDCSSLKSINVSGGNSSYCSVDGVLFSKDKTKLIRYPQAKAGTSYSVPNGVKTIESYAFQDCALASINISLSVKTIDDYAFSYCSKLKNVYYSGSSAQWKSIGIDKWGNDALLNAKIHYNYFAAPVIKITTSSGKPKISWNAVDGATKYYIYRSTDGKNYKQYTTTTKTSYTNSNAKIGTTYYYKVKAAKVVNGKTVYSAYSNVKSIKCVPAAPTVTISRSGGKAKLSWKAVTGATKYYIYRSTDGKTYKYQTYTTKLNYTDGKSASGTKYYYKVKAVAVVNNTNVGSNYSTAKSITTTLAKPTVKITTSNGKPKLTWSKVTGADKYYIYRSTDGKTFKYYTSTTKLTYTNTGAKKNTKYYYKVKAICSSSTSANSAYSSVVSIKATK